jgi:hypothetical protein
MIDFPVAQDMRNSLIEKLNRGLFVNEEWLGVIVEMYQTGWHSMANDLEMRRQHYQRRSLRCHGEL